MPTLIVFNEDSKEAPRRVKVDEEPDKVAATLGKGGLAKLTTSGSPVWINPTSVRLLRSREVADEAPAQ